MNDGYACAFINAWETDFTGDPFTAIVSELTDQLAKLGLGNAPNSKRTIAKKVGNYIVRRSLPALVKKATASAIDIAELHKELVSDATQGGIADLAAQIAEERLKGFGEAKKSIAEFRGFLTPILINLRRKRALMVKQFTYSLTNSIDANLHMPSSCWKQ